MARASYKRAICWIAHEDEPCDTDWASVAGTLTVALVADLWGKQVETVAKAVVRERLRRKEDDDHE